MFSGRLHGYISRTEARRSEVAATVDRNSGSHQGSEWAGQQHTTYHVTVKILFAAHYGVPQERWRLILLGSRFSEVAPPEPTHCAAGRANFRGGGGVLTFRLTDSDKHRLLPAVTVREAIGDLPRLEMGDGAETIGYVAGRVSDYANAMRNQQGVTYNHFAAKLAKQNAVRMKFVKPG